MAGGLVALLDDVAALVKVTAASLDDIALGAAKASTKSLGVVIDDAAVTPQYVKGLSPKRELPIIWKIAVGSIRNKLLIILPVALILSQFAPWALTPILMLGGAYLVFEGAEKLLEAMGVIKHHSPGGKDGGRDEKAIIGSAVRTDLVLSAEIMVISLNEVSHEPFLNRALILNCHCRSHDGSRLWRGGTRVKDGRYWATTGSKNFYAFAEGRPWPSQGYADRDVDLEQGRRCGHVVGWWSPDPCGYG